jgi:NDP-sugar pyrophosphorylase family protein
MKQVLAIDNFVKRFSVIFPGEKSRMPWEVTDKLAELIEETIKKLGSDFLISNDIAIHKTATIEQNVVLKGSIIIGENCFIGANAYLRGPVFLDRSVKIGPGCEIKQSLIFSDSSVAHFNYIGNSIVGSNVNFEAGAVAANHFNERADKRISVYFNSELIPTDSQKFGALVGDNGKIGANAVLSPGTILHANSVVKRLELIDQSIIDL